MSDIAETPPVVYIVDDDPAVREALESLFESSGMRTVAFASAQEFLYYEREPGPACMVLDVRMPLVSGLDLQSMLTGSSHPVPIVFITGHGDIPMSVQAMKGGALEFLTKPFDDQQLLDAVGRGLAQDRIWRAERQAHQSVQQRFDALSPRQKEVMAGVIAGKLNREIAAELGLSEITVKVHRGLMMEKMRVHSIAALMQLAQQLDQPR
ncbi:MAG: response regulator [Pseudomonadota bacterium]